MVFGIFLTPVTTFGHVIKIDPPVTIDKEFDHSKTGQLIHHLKGFNELINF